MEKLKVVVDSISRQGKGNLAITLMPVQPLNLPEWQAGAHINIYLPNHLTRQYSLTGSPTQREYYVICVKKEQLSRGGSQYIHENLRVGQYIEISPPCNQFSLKAAEQYLLIAAGIGITPILAMAEQLEVQGKLFELYYCVKTPLHLAFINRWRQGFKFGKIHVLYSSLGESLREQHPPSLQQPQPNTRLYFCGPHSFMQDYQHYALELGWQPEQIHLEAFHPAQVPTALFDTATNTGFQIKLQRSGQIFHVPEHQSIAHVLLKNRIDIPLSCEMGMCGACLTRVVAGEVDHRDSIQSDSEKNSSEQYIALCCSRAKSHVLELDL
ncbi:PDR/VanB family oxidoreductase [Acinetobacter sp. ANC 4640]